LGAGRAVGYMFLRWPKTVGRYPLSVKNKIGMSNGKRTTERTIPGTKNDFYCNFEQMYKLSYIVVGLILVLSSCSQGDIPITCKLNCTDNEIVSEFSIPNYYFPRFNPNNPNEFIYAKAECAGCISVDYFLCKYNLQTESGDTIKHWGNGNDIYVGSSFSWSSSGYIVTGTDGYIYRVNPVTGEAILLSIWGSGYYAPLWNYSGDRIIFERSMFGENYIGLMDEAGNMLDTAYYAWYNNPMMYGAGMPNGNYMLLYSDMYIRELDANLDSVATYSLNSAWVSCLNNCYGVSGFDKVGTSNQVAFCTSKAMYITDLSTFQTTTIATTCETNPYYGDLSVSSDGQKIIFTKLMFEKTGSCKYIARKQVHLMNIDGSNEQTLQLP
jgi:hypothetical protein